MLAMYQKCRHEKINMDMEKGKPVVSKGGGCCVYSVCGGGTCGGQRTPWLAFHSIDCLVLSLSPADSAPVQLGWLVSLPLPPQLLSSGIKNYHTQVCLFLFCFYARPWAAQRTPVPLLASTLPAEPSPRLWIRNFFKKASKIVSTLVMYFFNR